MSLLRNMMPAIVAVSVYIILSKLFPEEIEGLGFTEDQTAEMDRWIRLRGGTRSIRRMFNRMLKRIFKKILHDRWLKIAIASAFMTAGAQHFQDEIQQLLMDDIFARVCGKHIEGQLKIVCDIVQEYQLPLYTEQLKSLIINDNITNDQKIELLKIKLDYIINGEYPGRLRFFLVILLGAVLVATISGVGGLALILEALYRLFQEGKLSKAMYEKILDALRRKYGPDIPEDYVLT